MLLTEAMDLAKQHPDKLALLQTLFYAEAAKYDVLPIDNSKTTRLDPAIRPSLRRGRTSFTYYDGQTRIPEGAVPDVKNKSFRLTAEIEIKKSDEQGILLTQGELFGGYALMLQKGKPVFHYNFVNLAHYNIAGTDTLKPGKHKIVMDFAYDGGGIGKGGKATLKVDGKLVAQGHIERTIPIRIALDEGLDIGEDNGTPVNLDYDVPFKLSGELEKATIDLKPGDRVDIEAGNKADETAALLKTLRD